MYNYLLNMFTFTFFFVFFELSPYSIPFFSIPNVPESQICLIFQLQKTYRRVHMHVCILCSLWFSVFVFQISCLVCFTGSGHSLHMYGLRAQTGWFGFHMSNHSIVCIFPAFYVKAKLVWTAVSASTHTCRLVTF